MTAGALLALPMLSAAAEAEVWNKSTDAQRSMISARHR